MTKEDESGTPDQLRRTLLKSLAAAGAIGGGVAASTGSAAAKDGGTTKKLSFDVEETAVLGEERDIVKDAFTIGEEATFDGEVILEGLEVQENAEEKLELVATGRLKGTLSQNPTQQINQTFETVLGLLEQVLGLLSPDNAGECPILTLDIGEIFLDLLGLQVETSVIEIDITAVAGPGNLLGNLLCAVAGLLDP